MPNDLHLAVWPRHDDDLTDLMMRLMTAHVRRYHRHYHSSGHGHFRQGRFKAFPIQADEHLLTVLRYIERDPLRANLAERAGDRPWSSACPRGGTSQCRRGTCAARFAMARLYQCTANRGGSQAPAQGRSAWPTVRGHALDEANGCRFGSRSKPAPAWLAAEGRFVAAIAF
jgi:hypothetical protein